MPDDENKLNPISPTNAMRINASPLQLPGRDDRLRTSTVGGPAVEGDRRMYLSVELLKQLLEVAQASPHRRVQVHRAGVRVDLYRRKDGHQYEVWTFIGGKMEPEPLHDALVGLRGA